MRTVEDALRFKDRLKKNDIKHAVVIGASMAGIKVVEVLHKYGIETWLLDPASYIFPLAAYKEVAEEIEKRVEAQGVHLMFGVTIDHMEKENGEKVAVLTDGSWIPRRHCGSVYWYKSHYRDCSGRSGDHKRYCSG